MKKIIIFLLAVIVSVGGLFVYEVKKEHPYTPQTAEIIMDSDKISDKTFIIKDGQPVVFNLAEQLTFVSDLEKGTANLPVTKKVFGFYESEINYVYNEYTPAVSYVSSDETVATIDGEGVITALSKGKAVIIITADETVIEIPIAVYKGVEVTQMEQNITLLKGESKDILKLGEYEIALSRFESSNENVAVVNENGTVTAMGKGKAEIYTYKNGDKNEKIFTTVTVKQPVESLTLGKISLYTGDKTTLKAVLSPKNADYGTDISYSSANTSVATVSGNVLTAVKAGETTVTATSSNGVTTQAKVVVTTPPKAKASVKTISRAEFDAYSGEKYSDGSPYANHFVLTMDQPVIGFSLHYIDYKDDYTIKTAGADIYKNAQVPAGAPLYFSVCINTSDVIATRGFSYVNRDGSKANYVFYESGKDGSVIISAY